MPRLQAGDAFPEGVTFGYVPPTGDLNLTACGRPSKYEASKEFQNKKIVLFGVPGAFTPTCQEKHLTSYIENLDKLKSKGVDQLVVVASNDQFVMAAWGKANGINDESILFVSDPQLEFAKKVDLANATGDRVKRFLILVDNGKVTYCDTDDQPGTITKSGAEAALARL